ncbi:PTS sugar transporter subunit IIA, partial [Staphylococcus cohnii]
METIKAHANVFDEEGLYERIKDHLAYLQPISTINSATLSLNNELNLKDLLPTTHIKQCNEVKTMDEAIALASEPLLSAQYIEPQYVEAMQQHFDDTYMVIQNNIAIPHAMSDGGVKRTAMSMLVL